MADLNVAAPAVQPIVIGNKLITPSADNKTVKVSEKDGSNAQSMDLEAFKKYLEAHKEEIIAASKQNAGDTVNFKGSEEAHEAEHEKKGLTTGTKLLIGAAIIGVGIWQRKNLAKGWEALKGLVSKKPAETVVENAGKTAEELAAEAARKATKEGTLTPEAAKSLANVEEALKQTKKPNLEGLNNFVTNFEKEAKASKIDSPEHIARQKELSADFANSTTVTTGKLHTGTEFLVEKDHAGKAITFVNEKGVTINNPELIEKFLKSTNNGTTTVAGVKAKAAISQATGSDATNFVNKEAEAFERNLEVATNPNGPAHLATQKELEKAFENKVIHGTLPSGKEYLVETDYKGKALKVIKADGSNIVKTRSIDKFLRTNHIDVKA